MHLSLAYRASADGEEYHPANEASMNLITRKMGLEYLGPADLDRLKAEGYRVAVFLT
jgi:hypothetical protein